MLASLFATLAELHASTLLQKSVRLTIDPAPGSLRVAGDEELLQAIGNLLVNALDFTPPGGEITLGAWQEGERVIVRVTDTGSGIPDYALARIFERFYSLPRASGQKSSGLGLAFVQEVARLH